MIPTGSYIGAAFENGTPFTVLNKYTLEPLVDAHAPTPDQVDQALSIASAYKPPSGYERGLLLAKVRDRLLAHRDLFIETLVAEAGFSIADASGEFERTSQTLLLSGEEARRIAGDMVPFEGAPGGAGRLGFTVRVPLGIVVAITPFNAPMNTVCHKVGPAIAAGNAVILKPSDKTPLTANLLAKCFAEAGAPTGMLQVLHGGAETANRLLDDPRPAFFAFTGSTAVGRAIQAKAGLRRTQMELGSIAATIVCADATIETAAQKCAAASFRKAGQVCTSIQLLFVDASVREQFSALYLAHVGELKAGDPSDPQTDVGPMISEEAASRVADMVAGHTILAGGTRDRALMAPSVLLDPDINTRVVQEEIFGPVVSLLGCSNAGDAIATINSLPYGLATGVFTGSIETAMKAARALHVGGVHINETSSSRVDLMPYGGMKDSGFGLEGPRYAIDEMMDHRLITFSGLQGADW